MIHVLSLIQCGFSGEALRESSLLPMCGALPLIIGTAAEFRLNIFLWFHEGRGDVGADAGAAHRDGGRLNDFTTMAGLRTWDGQPPEYLRPDSS
jgi:hypothetical protein